MPAREKAIIVPQIDELPLGLRVTTLIDKLPRIELLDRVQAIGAIHPTERVDEATHGAAGMTEARLVQAGRPKLMIPPAVLGHTV